MAGRINEALFADPVQRAAFKALAGATSLHEAIEAADDETADLLRRLAVTEPDAGPGSDGDRPGEVRRPVVRATIEAEARQAEAESDAARVAAAGAAIPWLMSELEIVQEPGTAFRTSPAVTEAANRLVAWLLERYREAR